MASLVPFVRVGSAHAVRFVYTRRISVLGRIKRVAKNTKRNAVPIGFFPIELPVPHAANADFHHKVSVSRISLYSQSLQDHDPISSPRSQNLTQNRANSDNITFIKNSPAGFRGSGPRRVVWRRDTFSRSRLRVTSTEHEYS